MEDTMLEIRNLSKSYGEKKAVCNLNLIVEDGDIMGFIGKNGAGKTTTLKSCLGIVGIDKGEILLDGVSILKEPIVCKKKMAYVPDNITHIIKQSLPAILSALIGTLSTCGTCYLLLKYFSNSLLLGGYIVCGIILLLISILVLCLNRRGEHLYQAL